MKNKILLLVPVFLLAGCGKGVNRNVIKEVNYDATGKVLLTTEYSYKGDDVLSFKQTSDKGTSLSSYNYNSKGLLVDFKIQNLVDGNYVDDYFSANTYDNHDTLVATQDFLYDQTLNRYVLTDTFVYEYDSRGNMTKESRVSYDETLAVVMQTEIDYAYNDSNMITKEDEYFFNFIAGEMAYFEGNVYTYDSQNNLTKLVVLDENKETLMTSNYEYNDGLVKQITTTKVYEGEEKPFKVTSYEYDLNKNMTMEKTVYSVNGFGDEVIRQEFDKDNRCTKKSFYDLEGDQETLDAYYTYCY